MRIDRDAVWALLAIVGVLASTAWLRPLTLPDEGRYVGVAWEMLRSGDWLTPTLDGLPFFHKPPLFYWITAGALRLLGTGEGAARVAPLLGASAAAFALYLFVRRWCSIGTARASLLVLLTQPLFFIGSQFANLDMLVAGCIGSTILLAAHASLSQDQGDPAPAALIGAWGTAGLGVLAKGLIGIVLPALVLLAWLIATRRWRRVPALLSWPGMLLCLAITLPWFVAMQARYPRFLHYFFVVQHFQRFSAGGFNNVQPFWFYPVVLFGLGLPWVLWLSPVRTLRWWTDPAQGALRVLMGLWLLVVVLFFSLPQSKLVGYVLPAVPPLAFLVADAAAGLKRPRLWWGGAVLAASGCIAAVAALTWLPLPSSRSVAHALQAQRGSGEPVVFLDGYFYDLAFYARLEQPVPVVDRWDGEAIAAHDNWKKELYDAGRFAPATAAARLIAPEQLASLLCHGVSWVVAPPGAAATHPWIAATPAVVHSREAALWRIDPAATPALRQALDCPGTPSAAPPSR